MPNNQPQNQEVVEINPFLKPKNILVSDDKDRNLATLKVYGAIEDPEEYIEQLTQLEALSKTYEVLEITLNSPGGDLNTTIDILSIIKNFKTIITIGKGEIASAAFMIWSQGDIRVVTDFALFMAHRESYGMFGKTAEHRSAADKFGMVYEELFDVCFGDLLTDDEKIIAQRSETWITYKDLLSRDRVISYEEYLNPKNPIVISDMYITDDNKSFIFDPESSFYLGVDISYNGQIIENLSNFLYGIEEIVTLPENLEESEDESKEQIPTEKIVKSKKTKIKNIEG